VAHVTEKEVFQRLEQLERTVYVPIVPGEAAQWLETVVKAVKRVEETACEYFRTVHPELFGQIAEHDPEQMARVQSLEQEDEEIGACLHDVAELAEKQRSAANQVEPDERLIAGATEDLSDRAVALVQRIRRHETEISTWHVEALLRDRGAVD
jgi:hypothetical protein